MKGEALRALVTGRRSDSSRDPEGFSEDVALTSGTPAICDSWHRQDRHQRPLGSERSCDFHKPTQQG